jgi:hypothetical protein
VRAGGSDLRSQYLGFEREDTYSLETITRTQLIENLRKTTNIVYVGNDRNDVTQPAHLGIDCVIFSGESLPEKIKTALRKFLQSEVDGVKKETANNNIHAVVGFVELNRILNEILPTEEARSSV